MKKGKFIFSAALICVLLTLVTAQAAGSSYACRPFRWRCRPYVRTVIAADPTATPSSAPAASPSAAPTTTPSPTAAATPRAAKSAARTDGPEQAMLAMVNEDRAANGLAALVWDDTLAAGARTHSRDMAENNFFSHISPTYGSFATRFRAAGISVGGGENIAHYASIEKAEAAFLSSEGHRANLLSKTYKRIGIGIVESHGAYYITQWFAQ